jgi:superfamily II DNA/RNA helicase
MVCTDAVSRGLDLPEVDLIVNFDFPNSVKDYVHRCGRTGRISSRRKGTVVSFMAHRRDIAMALTLKQRLS